MGFKLKKLITKGDPPIQWMLEKVHINIIGPMPTKSVSGREYTYIVVDGYTLVVYMRLLWLKSEAADVFKSFRKAEKSLGPGYVW